MNYCFQFLLTIPEQFRGGHQECPQPNTTKPQTRGIPGFPWHRTQPPTQTHRQGHHREEDKALSPRDCLKGKLLSANLIIMQRPLFKLLFFFFVMDQTCKYDWKQSWPLWQRNPVWHQDDHWRVGYTLKRKKKRILTTNNCFLYYSLSLLHKDLEEIWWP